MWGLAGHRGQARQRRQALQELQVGRRAAIELLGCTRAGVLDPPQHGGGVPLQCRGRLAEPFRQEAPELVEQALRRQRLRLVFEDDALGRRLEGRGQRRAASATSRSTSGGSAVGRNPGSSPETPSSRRYPWSESFWTIGMAKSKSRCRCLRMMAGGLTRPRPGRRSWGGTRSRPLASCRSTPGRWTSRAPGRPGAPSAGHRAGTSSAKLGTGVASGQSKRVREIGPIEERLPRLSLVTRLPPGVLWSGPPPTSVSSLWYTS